MAALICLEAARLWQRKAILLQNFVWSLQKVLCRSRNKAGREVSRRQSYIAVACKYQDIIIPLVYVPKRAFLRKHIPPKYIPLLLGKPYLQLAFTLILEPLMGPWELSGRLCAAGQKDIPPFSSNSPGCTSSERHTQVQAHTDFPRG